MHIDGYEPSVYRLYIVLYCYIVHRQYIVCYNVYGLCSTWRHMNHVNLKYTKLASDDVHLELAYTTFKMRHKITHLSTSELNSTFIVDLPDSGTFRDAMVNEVRTHWTLNTCAQGYNSVLKSYPGLQTMMMIYNWYIFIRTLVAN